VLYACITAHCPCGFIWRTIRGSLPFNLGLVQFLADHRNIFLTKLANIAAFAGGVEGYILLAALIYVVWNKRLAIQLSVVMLAALSINDLLKMLVRNPRRSSPRNISAEMGGAGQKRARPGH